MMEACIRYACELHKRTYVLISTEKSNVYCVSELILFESCLQIKRFDDSHHFMQNGQNLI